MRILSLSLLVVPFVIACGGGPSDSTKIVDLSTDEAQDVCEETSFNRSVTCQGQTISIKSTDCTMLGTPAATCTATVGDARACSSAMESASDADLCAGNIPAACEKLSGCGSTPQ